MGREGGREREGEGGRGKSRRAGEGRGVVGRKKAHLDLWGGGGTQTIQRATTADSYYQLSPPKVQNNQLTLLSSSCNMAFLRRSTKTLLTPFLGSPRLSSSDFSSVTFRSVNFLSPSKMAAIFVRGASENVHVPRGVHEKCACVIRNHTHMVTRAMRMRAAPAAPKWKKAKGL